MSLRREVLKTYKRAIRLSIEWKAKNPLDTTSEQIYIRNEAKRVIRQNQHLTQEEPIRAVLKEANERIQVAQHYGVPYPRPVHYPTGTFVAKRGLKSIES